MYGDFSESGFGCFAEYICAPESAVIHKPEGMTFEEAAAVPHAAALAMQGIIDKGGLKPGQRLLINGAGGGVGSLGVQIAKSIGAKEITGVDRGDKAEFMRSIGFTKTIDCTKEDFTESGKKYDLILDVKTTRSASKYLKVLKPNGVYASVGGTVSKLLSVLITGALNNFFNRKKLIIVGLKPNKDMDRINRLYNEGKLKLFIDGPYSFDDLIKAIKATKRFGNADHKGKIIIKTAK